MNFVIGHPRSGTMFLSHLLNACSPGVSAHELLFALSWDTVWLSSEYYAERADAVAVRRLISHYQRREAGLRVDCNWKLTWILPVLLECFPEARVLHLLREPRQTIKSCLELDYYGTLWSRPAANESARRRNYWLRWMPEIRRADWATLGQLERNCAFYGETHRLASMAEVLGPRYLRMRIEDLDRDTEVARVADFFTLPPPTAASLATLRQSGRVNVKENEKREVRELRGGHELDEQTLERLCRPLVAALGY